MISPPLDCTLPINKANVRDRNVFITGGSDGIGAGLVRALSSAGAYVTFGDINRVKGIELQEELNAQGLRTNFVELDVTKWDSQVQAFKSALAFPPSRTLDMVFLNAGIAVPSLVEDIANDAQPDAEPKDPALKVYDVNLLGVVRGISLALHFFNFPQATTSIDVRNKKCIILTGSLVSYLASPTSETYGSSKFGVRGLFKGLRNSLPNRNVRVNMVAPTYVRTSLMAPIVERMEATGIKLLEVEDVVKAMMRLACDDSINGRAIGVGLDGAFDYGDDFEGHDGYYAIKTFIESGALGKDKLAELKAAELRAENAKKHSNI